MGGNFTLPPQSEPLKSPPRLGLSNQVVKNFQIQKCGVKLTWLVGLTFEIYQPFLVTAFLKNPSNLSQNDAIPKDLDHVYRWKYEKETFQTILLIILQNITKFLYSFHSPQVKRNLMSSTRNFIHEFSLEFLTLVKRVMLGKSQNYQCPVSPTKIKF